MDEPFDWRKELEAIRKDRGENSESPQKPSSTTGLSNSYSPDEGFLKDLQLRMALKGSPTTTPFMNPQKPAVPATPQKVSIQQGLIKVTTIAVGAFGSVYRVYQPKLGLWLAQKSIPKSTARKHPDNILNQIKVQLWIRHQNLIPLYHSFSDQHYIHLLMQLVIGDNLSLQLQKHPPTCTQLKSITRQLLSAVAYLHSHHIVHRDIKPENILCLNENYELVKLCDFGFSYYRRWEGNECLGTVEYMAPEVVAGEEYGEKVDVWGVGVVIYEMATGQMVVPQKDNRYVFLNNFENDWVDYSKVKDLEVRRIIQKCLQRDPARRSSSFDLLMQPWFNK